MAKSFVFTATVSIRVGENYTDPDGTPENVANNVLDRITDHIADFNDSLPAGLSIDCNTMVDGGELEEDEEVEDSDPPFVVFHNERPGQPRGWFWYPEPRNESTRQGPFTTAQEAFDVVAKSKEA